LHPPAEGGHPKTPINIVVNLDNDLSRNIYIQKMLTHFRSMPSKLCATAIEQHTVAHSRRLLVGEISEQSIIFCVDSEKIYQKNIVFKLKRELLSF
jgi:hypothetical protein